MLSLSKRISHSQALPIVHSRSKVVYKVSLLINYYILLKDMVLSSNYTIMHYL